MMGKIARALGITLVAAVLALVSPAMPSGATSTSRVQQQWGQAEEDAFVVKINELRQSKGLATLEVDPELQAQARIWSQTMKDKGQIFHTSDLSAGISADWAKLGENVGVGGDVQSLFDAFVASPKHYENLIDPAYRYIGVGVVWDGARMFTAHRFMALQATPAPTTAPPRRQSPTTPVASTGDGSPVAPEELAATEPPPPTPAAPPPPVVPPATPDRVALVLSTIDDLLG